MKLKYRFFLIFSALAVVPLFLFSYIAYNHYINLSNSQITDTSSKIMEQAVKETDSVFGSMQHILELVQYTSPNEETILQELGKFADPNSEHGDQDIYEANKKMKYIFQNFVFSTENINGIFIFTPSKVVLGQGYGNGVDVRSDYDPVGEDWYEKTLELEGKIYVDGVKERDYLLNDTPSISFSMCVYDVYSRDFLGVLYINCSPEIFSLDTVNVLPEATKFVIKRENEILYKSDPLDWENFSEANKESHKIEYNQEIVGEGVTLTAVFDKAGLAADFRVTLSLMLFALVVFLILFIVLAYFLARYLTEPITALSHIMAHPREKNRAVESPYMNRTDEIGTLYNQYQTMLEENNRYIKSEYENKMILMDTQMKALESQINAHFLYNTLEAINSLAEIEEAEDISVMALALGDMFRYSIKTKGALVTLEKELAHVKNFVAIQQIRFDNGFRFEMDVSEELYSCRILKLILQPLVENALYHGLLHCNAGSSIYLSARRENKIIYFTVKDDGAGMAPETLEQLQKLLEEKPRFGELSQHANESIGLKNINARIRLYYGEDYGLSVKSEQGCGTIVQIKIPELAEETKRGSVKGNGVDDMYTYVVIDDEPLIRRGILKKLENYPGIQCVAQASNGKAALEQIEEKDPDFVITDMKMPIMDGTQLLPVLSTQYPEKYIIVISGYKDFDYAKEALRAKTLDYIVKPFSREVLCSAVDKAVELLQSRETLQEKITLDEAEKEKLKYEYDRQILRNVLFGTDRDVSGLTSQKAREIQNGSQYVLLTVTMQEKLDEKVLSEFLLTRDLDVQTVLFTRDHTENMCFLLLAFPKEKSVLQREIMDIKNMLDDFFKSISGHPFYGISGVHKSLGELHKAFLETTEAMNQMTLEQKVNYVFYAENKENVCVLEWPKLELFLFLVESGKKDEMETVFPELFHYFARNEKCRLKDAKDYCLEITETLKKSLPKDMQIHKSTATSLNLITNLNFIFSFSELEEYFQRFFRNMSMAFESVGFYSEKDILENIKNYVDFHYEKDLTQEFVASLFRLNRSYLSSAFKARTGTSFVDYVNQVRISHAKEMLKKTDKKTYQIAQAVGYENAKYFFRVFKKMEGITPEQYRNQ